MIQTLACLTHSKGVFGVWYAVKAVQATEEKINLTRKKKKNHTAELWTVNLSRFHLLSIIHPKALKTKQTLCHS